jgi:hypothetical protein
VGNTTLTVTGTGANITGTLNVTGNANVGNLGAATAIITTGNITTINNGIRQNGNSNVTIVANANINFGVTGTANVVSITSAGIITTAANAAITSNSHTASGAAFGNVNVAATLSNLGFRSVSATYTDTAVTGTQANGAIHYIATPTITGGTNAKTYTNMATFYIAGNVTSGTNATITNNYAMFVGSGNSFFGGNINATGNVSGAYFIGNGSQLTGIAGGSSSNISNGTSNVSIPSANGNINLSAEGNANIVVVTGTGMVTSRLTVGAGTGGNVSGANVIGANTGNFSANVTAAYFLGNGSQLTGISTSSNTIFNGTSNVSIAAANGNITMSAVGNANIVIVTGTGMNVAGTANITGNLTTGSGTGGNITGANVISANTGTFSNSLRVSGQSGLGYSSTIGTATQGTSRNTAVTVSNVTGAITLFSSTTTANTTNVFTVTNSTVATTDVIILNQRSGTSGSYLLNVSNVATGSFDIQIYNSVAVAVAEAPVINFVVIKTA